MAEDVPGATPVVNGPDYWRGYIDGMKYIHTLYKSQGRLLPEPTKVVPFEPVKES